MDIKDLLPAVIVVFIIAVVGMYMLFMFTSGVISREDNAKNTGRALAEIIENEIPIATGFWSCKEFDVAIFPDYALIVDDEKIRVMHRNKETGEEEQVEAYPYEAPIGVTQRVCSPYGQDKSIHTSHCPDKLHINLYWDDTIVKRYCVCANTAGPEQIRDKILVHPKGGLTCAGVMQAVAKWGAETASSESREKVQAAYDKLEGAFRDEK